MKIAICDDSDMMRKVAADTCVSFFENRGTEYRLELFSNGQDLIECNEVFDIVLLDIEMPGLDGLNAAKELKDNSETTKIIFLTSHKELMREAFKVNAFRYLLKPLERDAFEEAIIKAMEEIANEKSVLIETKESKVLVKQKEITYIESLGDGVLIHCRERAYQHINTLKSWREKLDSLLFIQTHKSFLVNLEHIVQIEKGTIITKQKERIPLSKRSAKEVKEAFCKYIEVLNHKY